LPEHEARDKEEKHSEESALRLKQGQVAQLVEQGTENPRVGGSIPSLATFFSLLVCTLLGCSSQDDCEELCTRTANRLSTCIAGWPTVWDDFGATGRRSYINGCQNRWAEVRIDLEPRELDDALDQCQESLDALDQMKDDGETCADLRALFLLR
jgi:hypothetical protein